MRELAIRWIAVGKARQDRDLSLWVKVSFEGTSVIGSTERTRSRISRRSVAQGGAEVIASRSKRRF
jgi:hypothetical protein